MADNEHRGPLQDAASLGGKVEHASSLFRPRESISDVYGLAPEDGDQQADAGDEGTSPAIADASAGQAPRRGWRERLSGKRRPAGVTAPKVQGSLSSAFGKQIPDRVVIGHLVTDRSKEALIAARDAVGKHLAFPSLSWVHVERFRDGYFYEAHERGSGHSFLPDLVNALTLYPDRYAWIPNGDRVVKIELKGDRIKATLMTPQQSKLIRSGDVGPLQQSRKMREAISKGDRVLAVGMSVAAVGLVAFGLALFVRSSLNSTVALPEMVVTDYLPYSQYRILNRVDTRRYVERIEYDGSRWSIGYQDVPAKLSGAEREPSEPSTTVPGLLERAREMILPGSLGPAAAPADGSVVPAPSVPEAPVETPIGTPSAPVAPPAPPGGSAGSDTPRIDPANPLIAPSPGPAPVEPPKTVDGPVPVEAPEPAAAPPMIAPEAAAPAVPAPERVEPSVAAPPAPAPTEAAPPAASEGPRVISPEERRRRIAERNRAAQRALSPQETGQ